MPASVDVLFDGELSLPSDVDIPNRSSADPEGSRSSMTTLRSRKVIDLGDAIAQKIPGQRAA